MSEAPPLAKAIPPPRPIAALEYRSPQIEAFAPRQSMQMVIGFGVWCAGIALMIGLMVLASATTIELTILYIAAVVVPVCGEIALAIYFVHYKEWTHVVAGQLIGLGVTLLVPIGAPGFALFGRM